MKLLVIEDNPQISIDIANFLSEHGFVVEIAGTLCKAREKVDLYTYDLIILDIGLPDGSGL